MSDAYKKGPQLRPFSVSRFSYRRQLNTTFRALSGNSLPKQRW